MEEIILENKDQLIEVLNNLKSLTHNTKFKRKCIATFTFTLNDIDFGCYARTKICELFESDCSLCWVNWFVHEQLKLKADKVKIKQTFKNIDFNEVEKLNKFPCYSIWLEFLSDKDKNKFVNYIQSAIKYLEKT